MLAILEDAVNVYRREAAAQSPNGRKLFDEAEEWIESGDQAWIFSFENICAILALDAGYLRRGLRAWKEQVRRSPRPQKDEAAGSPATGEVLRKASGE